MRKVCMIVPSPMVKGGIAAVVNGYRGSKLEKDYNITYVESYRNGNKLIKLLKAINGYFRFIKVLLIDKPDIIHIHSSFGPSFYRKIPFIYMASWMKKPIINHIHGADFNDFYMNASDKKKKHIKKVYNKCTVLIALSEEWKKHLLQIVSLDKIIIIENYGHIHKDTLKERLNRDCNNTVLFLGELGKRKGCYDIPIIAKKVIKEIPDVRFVLGGTGKSEDEEYIKQMFTNKKISNCVSFPGWVRGEQKDKLLREADVFFLPSYNEGMPMSILDAMGYSLPIVSTNVGGIPKIVHNGVNGFCCEPGNVDFMVSAIIELLNNKEKRNAAAKASIDIVETEYSFKAHLKHLEEVYESCWR